ncbi:MAG: hypothetical protein QGG89_08180, partial [Vicinamibacterales bacterium]|nr:hypothetical protein [Vicinamibacterales bacterium]
MRRTARFLGLWARALTLRVLPAGDIGSRASALPVMTSTEYRRLRRLLQRERQKGVLAVDQL